MKPTPVITPLARAVAAPMGYYYVREAGTS